MEVTQSIVRLILAHWMASYSKSISNKLFYWKRKNERTKFQMSVELSMMSDHMNSIGTKVERNSPHLTLSISLMMLIDKVAFISRSFPIENGFFERIYNKFPLHPICIYQWRSQRVGQQGRTVVFQHPGHFCVKLCPQNLNLAPLNLLPPRW